MELEQKACLDALSNSRFISAAIITRP